MINLLPGFHETIVLPTSAEEVFNRLRNSTSNKPFIQTNEETLVFNGWIKEERFRISLRVHRPNNYLPLVIGAIESARSGTILMIDYRLFPTIRLLLMLWTILLVLGGLFISYQENNPVYLLIACGIILLMHGIVWSNFKLQLKITREAIHKLLL